MDRSNDTQRRYPHVRVEGGPRDRGRQYGEQARERIQRSRAAYEQLFAHETGWDWQRVTEEALRFREPIWKFNPKYAEELRGLAEGSGLSMADVLALNVRTEIMFAAKARQALSQAGPGPDGRASLGAQAPTVGECTSFAALSGVTAGGHVLVGQNWDWLQHAYDTVVVLEARQDGKPDYVTVVEAGLLAKTGMNSAGIGLATNALVTADDRGRPGVPYHVLRALLDAETVTEALETLQTATRSSSANFLIASAEGLALDVEAAPGGLARLSVLQPSGERLVHTNHFLSTPPGVIDLSLWAMPDSAVRLQQANRLIGQAGLLSPSTVMDVLADHADYPFSICAHPDERQAPLDQGATVASIIMDVTSRHMWLADGRPCEVAFRELDYTGILSKGRSGSQRRPAAGQGRPRAAHLVMLR